MYIKSLTLIDTVADKVINSAQFRIGANLVVDATNSSQHNKVGKTTFLKLIDISLGANNRKYLYFDKGTQNEATELKNLIENKRIAVELTLIPDFEHQTSTDQTVLQVDLFKNGQHRINGKKFGLRAYQAKLNDILFDNKQNIPPFRELIKSFVRIDQEKDNDAFLLTSGSYTSKTGYRAIYDYLLDIADPNVSTKRDKTNKLLSASENAEQRYKESRSARDLPTMRQMLEGLEKNRVQVQAKLDDILSEKEFQSNRDKIMSTRDEYLSLKRELSDARYKYGQNQRILSSARERVQQKIDSTLTREFFDEVKKLLPDLDKDFTELEAFNSKLDKNKIIYYSGIQRDLTAQINILEQRISVLLSSNESYMALIRDNNIDEYTKYLDQLSDLQAGIGRLREMIDTLEGFDREQEQLKKQLSDMDKNVEADGSYYESKREQFNNSFTPFARRINKEEPILTYNPNTDKYPVGIAQLSGISTGTKKSLIAAFDLAYQQFAREIRKEVPNFIVHDVVETVEKVSFRAILDIAGETKSQYIVAVLKEKLSSSDMSPEEQDNMTIITLSKEDRLFDRAMFPNSQGLLFKDMGRDIGPA